MSRRRLRPDELELWHQVARSAERMHPDRKPVPRLITPAKPKPPERPDTIPQAWFEVGSAARPQAAPPRPPAPVQMDAKAHTKLKRGKMRPEARIDLHGMTLDQAHPALTRFILTSQGQGRRLVLVITGKGRDDSHDPVFAPQRRGILKRQVPLWLCMAPVGQAVIQVTDAHQRHGGHGALYVYLRRTR